jgi:AraC family transcriptional regulator
VIVVNLGNAIRGETYWAGERPGRPYVLEAGSVAVYPAFLPYKARWLDAAHVILLAMDPELLRVAQGGDDVQLRPASSRGDPFLAHLILALYEVLHEGTGEDAACGDALANTIARHVARRYAAPAPNIVRPRPRLPMDRVRRIAEYVDEHLEAGLSLHELAVVAQMSVFHFARLFKERTGLPPHRFVLRRRLERAKALLAGDALTVADVALRCGFSHQSHFAKAFRQLFGVTPTDYREEATTRST